MASLRVRALAGAIACAAALLVCSTPAAIAGPPHWSVESRSAPTYLEPGHEARLIAVAGNLGSDGVTAATKQVVITDRLSAELKVPVNALERSAGGLEGLLWVGRGRASKNSSNAKLRARAEKEVVCSSTGELLPISAYHRLEVEIPVEVGAGGRERRTQRSQRDRRGSNCPGRTPKPEGPAPAEVSRPVTVRNEPTPFGIEGPWGYQLAIENEDGTPDARAGSHPYQLTTTLDLNQSLEVENHDQPGAPALPGKLDFNLPPGLLGDPRSSHSAQT